MLSNTPRKLQAKNWLAVLTIFWAAIILALHGISGNSLPKVGFLQALHPDKLFHAFLFWVLATLWLLYLKLSKEGIINDKQKALVVSTCITYGLCLECSQFYIFENRSFDPIDWLSDIVGALVAMKTFKTVHSTIINNT